MNHRWRKKRLGNGCAIHYHPRTLFQQYLDDQQIEHLVAEPHAPQTQGKVERLIQTIKRECFGRVHFASPAEAAAGLADYISGYNFGKPHQDISGARPAAGFTGWWRKPAE